MPTAYPLSKPLKAFQCYTLKSGRAWESKSCDIHAWVAPRFELHDFTFDNDCLKSSSSASRLSEGRLLEKVSALYIKTVNYSKSVMLTFGSLSIACIGLSRSTSRTWLHLPGPPAFQRATLKRWDGPGYEATYAPPHQEYKFRHPCNWLAALKTTFVLLCKLFLHCCLQVIKLTARCGFSSSNFQL